MHKYSWNHSQTIEFIDICSFTSTKKRLYKLFKHLHPNILLLIISTYSLVKIHKIFTDIITNVIANKNKYCKLLCSCNMSIIYTYCGKCEFKAYWFFQKNS